jgi:hypothetical protein
MHKSKHRHHQHEVADGEHFHRDDFPYWRRAHRDWRFWVAVFFLFAAITIYFMSDDLAFVPGSQPPPPNSGAL